MPAQSPPVFNGRYELIRQLARGGMAEVYLGRDQLLDRQVALKVLSSELSRDEAFVERFRREAQSAANLSHPNVVNVYDWGEQDDSYFIVMEYVPGRTLSELIRAEGPLPAGRAATIGADIAAALGFAHRNGVVHRDVKPGNVLITDEDQVKVTDFGIARATNESARANLTQTGAVLGTATYFSPEQAEGAAVDARGDVYSLGVVLYEMVTGQAPFSGDNPVSIAYKHVRETPVPPRLRNPAVPAAFEAVVMRSLAKAPRDRYQSADELRADLLRFAQGRPVAALDRPTAVVAATRVGQAAGDDATRVGGAVADDATRVGRVVRTEEEPRRNRSALLAAILVFLLALLALLLVLLLRALHNDTATTARVPNVIGQQAAQARFKLESDGFIVHETDQPNPGTPAGVVFNQKPRSGTSAAKGDTVTIYVATVATKPVPNVIGKDATTATDILQAAGFVVSVNNQPNGAPSGQVYDQNPEPNQPLAVGQTVTIDVSSGQPTVTVPDVSGETPDVASNHLGQAGLSVAGSRYVNSDTIAAGEVVGTSPGVGTSVPKGSAVTLLVSTGPRPTTTTAPPTTAAPTTTTAPPTTAPPTTRPVPPIRP